LHEDSLKLCLDLHHALGNPNDRGASLSSQGLILTPDTSPETQVSSDSDAAGIPEPPRERYPPVASITLGAVATIPPLSRFKKSLLFISYGLALLGDLRLTVHRG
jgi:hypothetical protein